MKISIISPSYNQGQFLEQTIDSVLSQNYPNLEYMVVDGGSTDNSVEIIKKYEKNLTWWVSEKDKGQSHAINKGLRRSTGEIVNWINSDDYLEPDALKTIADAFVDPTTNVFLGTSNIVENDEVIRQLRGTDVYPGNLAKTIGQARIDQPETWWRKSVIDEIGPLHEELKYTMDRDWWVKYLLRYGMEGIVKSTSILANFRWHGDSKTVSQANAFTTERNNYYHSLADYYNLPDHRDLIQSLENSQCIPMSNLPMKTDMDALKDAFSYFFLLLADEAYVQYDFLKTRKAISNIDMNCLTESDRTFANKLAFRSRLPKTLISLARKFRK